jgi:uncharacterized RmlC-like cupin family protein
MLLEILGIEWVEVLHSVFNTVLHMVQHIYITERKKEKTHPHAKHEDGIVWLVSCDHSRRTSRVNNNINKVPGARDAKSRAPVAMLLLR